MTSQVGSSDSDFFRDLMKIMTEGTSAEKDILLRETDLLAQCHVCKNIFTSVVLLLNHKQYYCTDRVSENRPNLSPTSTPSSDNNTQFETSEPNGDAVDTNAITGEANGKRSTARRQGKKSIPVAKTKNNARELMSKLKEQAKSPVNPVAHASVGSHVRRPRKLQKTFRHPFGLGAVDPEVEKAAWARAESETDEAENAFSCGSERPREPSATDLGSAESPPAIRSFSVAAAGGQTALLKIRASTREKKIPKWMEAYREDGEKKRPPRSRKPSASTASHVQMGHNSNDFSPSAKQTGLNKAISSAKPAERTPPELDKKRLQCDQCSQTFANKKSFRFHYHKQHSGNQPSWHHCTKCAKKYSYSWGLKRHLIKSHKLSEEQIQASKELKPQSVCQQEGKELQAEADEDIKRRMAAAPSSGNASDASPSSSAAGSGATEDPGADD